MSNIYKYKTNNGLNVIFIKKEGFIKKFAGIGVKFGGANKEFIDENGKKHTIKSGVAHYIEHKLFEMIDGSDAFKKFSAMNTYSNAYTALDKTIYYISKNGDIIEPLKLLIEMFFTPSFKDNKIDDERKIILSELNMNLDNEGYNINQKSLDVLYPNDALANPILGKKDDIMTINKDDLYFAYNNFYNINNIILTICGDYDENYLFNEIEKITTKFEFINKKITISPVIKSKNVLKPCSIKLDVMQDELELLIRIDEINNLDYISTEKLLGALEVLLSIQTPFYNQLHKSGLIPNGIDYTVNTLKDTSFITITAPSKKPKLLAKKMINYLKNFNKDEIDLSLIDLYFKATKAKTIVKEDYVASFGEEVLSLALEDIDYEIQLNDLLNLCYEDILNYLDYIKNGKFSYLIVEKKENI